MTAALTVAPGVYDLPAERYHADPVPGGSLSSTGARKLLPPSCPALYRHWQDNPQPPKREFDLGHAAHTLVLGAGAGIHRLEYDNWRTNACNDDAAAARADGLTPLLAADHDVVLAMAAALRKHPMAAALLAAGSGDPERTLIWQDRQTGVWRRALVDWLRHPNPRGRYVVTDYKTCRCASNDAVSRAINDRGYHQQGDWYCAGVKALGLSDDPLFVLIAQEKTPPYLVNVVQPDRTAMRIGAALNRDALRIYQQCAATDTWPGYSDDVEIVALPPWAERGFEEGTW